MGLLVQCPKCNATIARGSPCPQCHWSENAPDSAAQESLLEEFQRRESLHVRNYAMYMVLMLGTGLIGLLTAIMWGLLIFRGNLLAGILLIPLTIATFALGYFLKMSGKYFPTALNCPSCDTRLDELGWSGAHCPGCNTQLRP